MTLYLIIAFIGGLVVANFVSKSTNQTKRSRIPEALIVDLLEMLGERQSAEKAITQEVTDLTVLEKLYLLGAATPIALAIHMRCDPENVKQSLQKLEQKKYVTLKAIKSNYERQIYQVSELGKNLLKLEETYQQDNVEFLKILSTIQKRIDSKLKLN